MAARRRAGGGATSPDVGGQPRAVAAILGRFLLLLSKESVPDPLVGAKSVRLRFRRQATPYAENCAHSLAPPLKTELAALDFGFVFSFYCGHP